MQAQVRYFADSVFLAEGWAKNVLITVDADGWITEIQKDQTRGTALVLNGSVLPGMPNVHSHAFQRAMAGLTEQIAGEKGNFWTWRDAMYTFLKKLSPEDLQAIAAQLYVEMLKAGYTSVGEFHYIHHQPDGSPYQDRALTSHHIIMAAKETGIAITHMPVLYAYSNFGGQPPVAEQQRFINDELHILNMLSSLITTYKHDPQITIGFAFHSLRAISSAMLKQVLELLQNMRFTAPIHIHIAEQLREVKDCVAWYGQRPVEWLLDNADVNRQWCLVHATNLSEKETERLAVSGAAAGLCPTTEANLGDGFFNLFKYLENRGCWGIGSDSNISVSPVEELRWLEYGQRLVCRKRNIAKMPGQTSIGASLYRMALAGGAQALGREIGTLAVGKRADFIALDLENPTLLGKHNDFIFDAMIFAGNLNPVRHVIVGGRQVVKDFRHGQEDDILAAYTKTLNKIVTS